MLGISMRYTVILLIPNPIYKFRFYYKFVITALKRIFKLFCGNLKFVDNSAVY